MQTHKRFIAIVGLVAALLTLAAASATAATLSAPVVKELFTPMKCTHGDTTLAIEACAEQQILNSDKTIDALNAKIFAKLTTTTGKRDFVNGHNAWLKYRTAYCRSESDIYEGGTGAGIIAGSVRSSV